ncbi:hypothetical protein [Tatumella sp. OPLPL6]|uniref:hypothetical protein n=1 Tax=Tatumella sp. OPLPL6 TaxID=1928657 RepID=UPI000C17BC71|nr:hypothetical protein [Tatumella sp. OPLPL6]PIJ43364.1 hypothetical protein BOM24_09370 [Tatumella sp. OPLPL6]
MATFTDKKFEEMYRDFRNVHAEWETLIKDALIYSDTDTRGIPFRFVGLINDPKLLEKAEQIVADWQRFADVFNKQAQGSKSTILKETYLPVPYIVKVKKELEIIRRPASTSFVHPRESLLSRYDSTIARFSKVTAAVKFIDYLKQERDFFLGEPEGTLYRLRATGFTELTYLHNPGADLSPERAQIGAHGALFFSETMTKDDVSFRDVQSSDQRSVYDRIAPLPCSVLDQGELYRVDDVEFERQFREAYRLVQRNDVSMRNGWEKREKEARRKYRGTEKYNTYIANANALRPIRKWLIEQDYILVERLRDTAEFDLKSIVDIRARYLYDDELATGYYPKTVNKRRQELIDEGIPLYQDLFPKKN